MIYPLPGGHFRARGRQTLLKQSHVITYLVLTPLTLEMGGGGVGVYECIQERRAGPQNRPGERKE